MEPQQIEQFIAILKSGRRWQMGIPEGHMDMYLENGSIYKHEFQVNPYSGERTNQTVEMSEENIHIYFKYYNAEEVMKCFV